METRVRLADGRLMPAEGVAANLDRDMYLRRLRDHGDIEVVPAEAPSTAPAAAPTATPAASDAAASRKVK